MEESVGHIRALPTLPAVLSRIVATTADPDASVLELSQHVASDQSLAATLLKLVNSAYYGRYRQVFSITDAIVMLGFHEVRNITLATTAFRTFAQGHPDFDRIQLWKHSLATAMAAEIIAKKLGVSQGAFASGLLHDIGKVALDLIHPRLFRDAAHKAHQEGLFIRDTEAEVLGITHQYAGGILVERWELPQTVVEAVRNHHEQNPEGADSQLTAIVSLADYVTYQAGIGESSNGREAVFPPSAASLPLVEADWIEVTEHIHKNTKLIEEFVGVMR
jgi:putative nucleotidyltransferase with HDIG domain